MRRLDDACDSVRSLPPGHVAAGLGPLKQFGLEKRIAPQPSPRREQVLALLVVRLREEVEPAGLDGISALRGPALRSLGEAGAAE